MQQHIMSIDIGTTKIKAVKLQHQQTMFEEYHRYDIKKVIEKAIEKDVDVLLLTGSGVSDFETEKLVSHETNLNIHQLNELECVANFVKYQQHETGLVVNIGTGTSFLYYEQGTYEHVSGTGIGGGTFEGLSKRLLSLDDPKEVEALAKQGSLEKINLVIQDIYKENLGWLQNDITVSNFAKSSMTDSDIALGIHSIVIEPIMSIIKGIIHFKSIPTIYFTGGVMNNKVITSLVEKYAAFFHIDYTPFLHPSYATALGAIEVYKQRLLEASK